MMQAIVEVLTAEVRTLMVGSRQVTISVFKQLDSVPPSKIKEFGRVSFPEGDWVVGKHRETGALVRSNFSETYTETDLLKKMEEDLEIIMMVNKDLIIPNAFARGPGSFIHRGILYETKNGLSKEAAIAALDAQEAMSRKLQEALCNAMIRFHEQYYNKLPLIVLAGLR